MGFEKGGGFDNTLRVTCGAFVGKVGGEDRTEHAYTGYLRSIRRFTDEYKGEESEKVEIVLSDGAENLKFIFTLEAWYAVNFFQLILNIDIGEKFTLGVMQSEENEKISFAWAKQGGKKIEKDKRVPTGEKKKVGTKTVVDYTKFIAAADKIIKKLQGQLIGAEAEPPAAQTPAQRPVPATKPSPAVAGKPANDDDLPF